MSKYRLNRNELTEHWNNQINFIKKSIIEFDKGDENEAQRIALNLRVLFHNTNHSKSLYSQLNHHICFLSIGTFYTPSNLIST